MCDAAPLSDQLANTYCTPVPPACVAAAIVWLVPGVHCTLQGDVQFVPSTVSDRPAGELATVTATGVPVKLAVTVAAPFIVTFCGVVVPVNAPEKPLKVYPPLAVALTCTTVPLLCHPLDGLMLPPAVGLAAVVRKYCVVKLAV